jgi:hypothetical protein
MTKDAEIIRTLRERIDKLEEENRQLREGMAHTDTVFTGILTRQQVSLLYGIYSRKVSSYTFIDTMLARDGNLDRGDGRDLEKLRSKVSIYNLRKRLKPYGIEISTWRGIGYYLNDANREKLQKLMEKKDD